MADEIRTRVTKHERVLVTTLTKHMAEDLTEHLLDEGFKVNYMHSDTATLDRIDIIRALRTGTLDVLVGINLLREGLDIPEVSLVAILDADKEGFLRNKRSLIQTMGRAARNAAGSVIMYADRMTDSMQIALDETKRRRTLQMRYNAQHHIVPQTIKKSMVDVTSFIQAAHETLDSKQRKDGVFYTASGTLSDNNETHQPSKSSGENSATQLCSSLEGMPKEDVAKIMGALQDEMLAASASMDFERAAKLRDQIVELQSVLEGLSADDILARLKVRARSKSSFGRARSRFKK